MSKNLLKLSLLFVLIAFSFHANSSTFNESNYFNTSVNNYIDYSSLSINNIPFGYSRASWRRSTKYNGRLASSANHGDNVKIAVFDTAIQCLHENLKTNTNRNCTNYYYNNGATFNTSSAWQHGTNVAGVAAGTSLWGVAQKADIVGYAVFSDQGWYISDNQYYNYVKHAVDIEGAKVINMSYGANLISGRDIGRTIPLMNSDMNAIRLAKNKALVVKAAGNGNNSVTSRFYGKGQFYLTQRTNSNSFKKNVLNTTLNNLIFVGALNANETSIASWSDRPGNGCFRGKDESKCTKKNQYKYYFIVAPGYVKTTNYDGGYNNTQGTSFAAPIVSGTAALIQSKWPNLKPHQIRAILLRTATDMGAKGVDPVYGWGKLNITRALQPVNGRIGGIRLGQRSTVFNRLGHSTSFKNEPFIYDDYDRDFQATKYFHNNNSNSFMAPVFFDDISLNLNFNAIEASDGSLTHSINGISFKGYTYLQSFSGITSWENFNTEPSSIYIQPTLAHLISGNSLIGYDTEHFSVFASFPSKDTINPTSPHTLGLAHKSNFESGLIISNTFGSIKENGFFGVNSIDGFGFEKEMTNLFFITDASNTYNSLDYSIRLENHLSPNSYSSDIISWSNLSLSKLSFDVGHNWDNQRIGISIKSPLLTRGQFNSSIDDMRDLDDFYHEDEAVLITYDLDIENSGVFNTMLSSENDGTASINYQVKF